MVRKGDLMDSIQDVLMVRKMTSDGAARLL